MKKLYITGSSSGIGLALSNLFLEIGFEVEGMARRNVIKHPNYIHHTLDLSDLKLVSDFKFSINGEVDEVVKHSDISLNSELSTIKLLNEASLLLNKRHGVIVMIDLGDLREGIFNESVKSSNRGIIAAKYNIRFLSLLVALNPLMVKNQLVIKSLMVMYSLIRLTIEISSHFLSVKKRLFSSIIIFFEFLG